MTESTSPIFALLFTNLKRDTCKRLAILVIVIIAILLIVIIAIRLIVIIAILLTNLKRDTWKRGGVLLTEIPLPRIARQGIVCLISIRG